MNDRSRWLVLAALGLLLLVLGNSHFAHFSPFHGGFRLFGFNSLLTAILLAVVIWFVLDRCGGCSDRTTTQATESAPTPDAPASDSDADSDSNADAPEHENEEDPDITG